MVQGWVYKFMPVKADEADYIQGMGGVDALSSYDILKNKCAWGNLNDPHVYVDPESLNNAVRPKTNFMRVAQSLVSQGKNKEAIEMLDTYIKYFPDSKVPYDMYMLPYAEIYYKAGAPEKANKLITRVAEICSQNLDYYYSFSPAYSQYFEQDVQTALGIMKRMSLVASENHQPQLAAKIDTLFNLKIKSMN
jgi:tetratricopeptide (TPR) repeat protein